VPAPTFRFILSFDFDGTLVHPEGEFRFHPALGEMIRGLRKQGAAWVINTGRSLSQTLQGLAQYGIFQEPDFIIAQECEIYKPGFFRQWTDLGAWNKQARKAHDHFLRDHAAFLKHIKNLVETQTRGQFLEGDLGQVGIVAHTDEELDAICELIEQHREQEPEVGYHRNGIYLRFSHSGYSKGSALGELARQLNLTPNECFAAGDNFNDLTMLDLSVARMIACPGNALPPVKAHVREQGGFIAQGIASTGMMEALQHFFGGAK
jgi:HAD superfamily hydrolase (TIGR01484 family)